MRCLLLTLACPALLGSAFVAQTIEPPFSDDYHLVDLGPPPAVPGNLGGLALRREEPDTLYVVGQSSSVAGAVYRIGINRDGVGHVTGFSGPGVFHAAAPDADGGLQFGPGGVLFFTRFNMNELGQIQPGSLGMNRSIPLGPLGVASSVGGLAFVPFGHPRAGDLTLLSFNASTSYTATLEPDGSGTYDITSITPGAQLSGGPEGFVYVPPRSPGFEDFGHVIVCEWGAHAVSTFELDAAGDPVPATRRVFVRGIPACQGAVIDPLSGDLLISIFGASPVGTNHVFAVRGFGAWRMRRFEGTPPTIPAVLIR